MGKAQRVCGANRDRFGTQEMTQGSQGVICGRGETIMSSYTVRTDTDSKRTLDSEGEAGNTRSLWRGAQAVRCSWGDDPSDE